MKITKIGGVVLACAASTASTFAQEYMNEGRTLVACYDASAEYYGRLTCDPPSTMLGAVFGRCTREEGALRRVLAASRSSDPIFLDNVIKNIRSERETKLQSIILDARIQAKKSCP
jgi:hypothetical protein